ncbi:hypothetical protein [uncultured Thiodictyon sp.]|jgi:hypothetical protein|uniref:hypothetical protein n=1 Tax=uncultured Thiodictyon sp. TaxID=1846217 RepID=UPI0025F5D4E9|nr:hypothetical protein [uncultured Thiodictyon sp.]
MPVTTMPSQRIARMLREGARLMAVQHGQTSIDVTPDIIALLDGAGEANACDHGHDRLTRLPSHEEITRPREAGGDRATPCR